HHGTLARGDPSGGVARRTARVHPGRPELRRPCELPSAPAGSPLSEVNLLHRLDLEITLGNELLEFRVLGFQDTKAFHVGSLHCAELAPPDLNALLADLV